MKNATMLYKAPGPHDIHGGHYDYIVVDADEEGAIDAAKEAGWFETTTEAKAAKDTADAAKAAEVQKPDNLLPATRAELEQKANELGIKFNDKTSDKKLRDLIAATLEN
jgi:uncharacterized protein YunC (DUF1805 family)